MEGPGGEKRMAGRIRHFYLMFFGGPDNFSSVCCFKQKCI